MSKKGVDYPELRAQLETLNNKELHHKCVEHGMNVPVADSTRDVIIRKLIKSITGDTNVTSPKTTKTKQQPSTPTDRRKTVNVTVHVSSDEDEVAAERQTRAAQNITKTRTRTQSPKGHNVTFDTTTAKVDNQRRANTASSATTTAKPIIKQQNTQRFDANANSNAGVGLGSNARILPLEVDLTNNMDCDEYNIELRRNEANSTYNRDVNLNRGLNYGNDGLFNTTPVQQLTQANSGYRAPSTLGYSQTSMLNSNYQQDVRDTPFSGYRAPSTTLGYSQTRNTNYLQDEHTASRQGFISSPPENTINRPLGYYSPGSPPDAFNKENKASHSSTFGSQYGVGTSPTKQDSFFKRPQALSKSNVTTTSYNEDDAQRLYPRLPTDLPLPPSYSTSSPESPQSPLARSQRESSLTKSGVMTTSYYQEISPVQEVKHYEVESGDEPAIGDGAGDFTRRNTGGSGTLFGRSSYLADVQRNTDTHLPFESNLKSSTLRDTLDSSLRYTSSPLARESYTAAAAPKPPSPLLNQRYSTTSTSRGGNTSYTRSIDEPDSGSDTEKLSGDEIYVQDSEDEEYVPEQRKIYSSFGSNKIQERVPYRRSNTARLSASPSSGRYSQSALGRQHLHDDDDEDDVDINASLRNFVTTLDRKYHIKQMFYMFAIFAAAVFVYVLFIEKPPNEDDLLVAAKAAHI